MPSQPSNRPAIPARNSPRHRQNNDTLQAWREEIAAMWRFTGNNGITEGCHNKMELITRQTYGFRNFQNYRLRVKVSCG
jgi:transposase